MTRARFEPLLKLVLAGFAACSVLFVWRVVTRRTQRRSRFWLVGGASAVGAAVLVSNHVVLRNDYPGVHVVMTLVGMGLIAAALATSKRKFLARRVWVCASVPLTALALFAVVTRPSQTVLVEMMRAEGSSLAPYFAQLHAGRAAGVAPIISGAEWFADRATVAPVPASASSPVPASPIVLFVTIDALRADILRREKLREYVPTLATLAKDSVSFTAARTPGSQTVYTLTTVFAGTYFSQQFWSTGAPDRSTRATDSLFPHADETVRFPELLRDAGIPTVTFASSSWLVNSVGVVRGFDEEEFVQSRGEKYTKAPDLTKAAMARLRKQEHGPLFLYMHYLDAHAPYDRGRKIKGSAFKRYLEELRLVDTELGRLIKLLKKTGAWKSTVLIVSADHGEAFGEHGTRYHATTLYDEQLLVPLLVRVPGVDARRIDTPVGLIDLGPTILDMFGLPTPSHFLGQSLLGFFNREEPRLTRPIIAEGRLKKSWVFEDGFKLIVDDRSTTVELYDLNADPKELVNVFDSDPTAEARLATLRAFFEAHQIRRAGYEIPYRR